MNMIPTHFGLTPDLLEESRRELDRQLERERQIREVRAARRAARPSRFATLTARLRHVADRRPVHAHPCPPLVEGC
jgi:hypothetical protein